MDPNWARRIPSGASSRVAIPDDLALADLSGRKVEGMGWSFDGLYEFSLQRWSRMMVTVSPINAASEQRIPPR